MVAILNLITFTGYAIISVVMISVLVVAVAFALELVRVFFGKGKNEKNSGGKGNE